jgi:hypothetical protein
MSFSSFFPFSRTSDCLASNHRWRVLPLLAMLATCSCAGRVESRNAARATLGETVRYEQEVDAKISTEKQFYKDEEDLLSDTASKSYEIAEQNIVNADQTSLSSLIIKDKGQMQPPELISFGTGLISAVRANEIASRQYETHLQGLDKSLASLDLQKAELAGVRHDLEQLQAGPSTKQQLQSWIDFGTAVEKKASTSAATNPSNSSSSTNSKAAQKPQP